MAATIGINAPSFETCGVTIAEDGVKGRVVFAQRDFQPGEVIFMEKAFVYATWRKQNVCVYCEKPILQLQNGRCDECTAALATATSQNGTNLSPNGSGLLPNHFPHALQRQNVGYLRELLKALSKNKLICEWDRARCLLKCLAMVETNPNALDHVLTLSSANPRKCLSAAQKFRHQMPEIFPSGFSDQQMAKLIGVLNTNSHELEHFRGSGLFLSACRMEHNCAPNCSFTTLQDVLWMTAIKPIRARDALSIDYGNFFYRPTSERLASLKESYGFDCTCDACVKLPDPCRAFKCRANNGACHQNAIVYGYPTGTRPGEIRFQCSGCGYTLTPNELAQCEREEQQMLSRGFPETLDEWKHLVANSVLHESHYLHFWALDAIGCETASVATNLLQSDGTKQQLAEIWQRIIALMNLVVPNAYHEKVIYYDNLAQVQVVLGHLDQAREAYAQAYTLSCIVSGRDTEPTLKIRQLMENPPRDAQELRVRYAKDTFEEDDDDDDDDDHEMDDGNDDDSDDEESDGMDDEEMECA